MREEPADNLMAVISRPWYNGSCTMAAKLIKSLELHYTMIQFLIIWNMKIHGLLQNLGVTVLLTDAFNSHDLVKVAKIFQHLTAQYQ